MEDSESAHHVIVDHMNEYRIDFAELYKTAFGEAPYFESYTIDEVIRDVWDPHVRGSHCVIVVTRGESVIGLGCAHAVEDEMSSIGAFLAEQAEAGHDIPFPTASTLYMSELAVAPSARGNGLGSRLVELRHQWGRQNGFTHFCMRTAAEGSNSRRLYERLGALVAPFVQDVTGEAVESQSDSRIILYGTL